MINTPRAGYRDRTYISTLETSHVATTLNPHTHNRLQYTTPTKCENTGFRGNSTCNDCAYLYPSAIYAMISGVVIQYRKAGGHDKYGRKIPDSRADWRASTSLARYHYAPVERWKTQRFQSQKPMACEGKRLGEVLRGNQQYPGRRVRQIKKRATCCGWLGTTKNFASRASPRRRRKLMGDGPSNLLPVSSIHIPLPYGKSDLYKILAGDRRENILCTIFSPLFHLTASIVARSIYML